MPAASNLVYLLIVGASAAFPVVYTLIHRRLLRRYGYFLLNSSVFRAAVPFILIDIWAIDHGWWTFNPRYVTGLKLGSLPLEEVLFMTLIPQATLLIWVALTRYRTLTHMWADIRHHFDRASV